MSNKVNSTNKIVIGETEKNSTDIYPQSPSVENDKIIHKEATSSINNCNTLIEVTVKTKGRKLCTMVSGSPSCNPSCNKVAEEKRRSNSNSEPRQNWGHILREQNRAVMKQSLQQIASWNQISKSTKRTVDSKKTLDNVKHRKKESKNIRTRSEETATKHAVAQKKSAEPVKTPATTTVPSSTSVTSSMESILVVDRGVQCSGVFEHSNDRFGVFNPVRTIGFLMKELEGSVKDERSSKILTDMEQALLRIPMDIEKPISVDLEAIALRTKLDTCTVQLEETSKKMNAMCESLREERDTLQRQVYKQASLLEEAHTRQTDLNRALQTLRLELNEAMKTIDIKDKKISELKEEYKNIEVSQKVISDLRLELTKQSELARQKHLDIQYLLLEKDKLSVLSSYKDTVLKELRTAVKELQSHIGEQLIGLKEVYNYEETVEPQSSVVRSGFACSSLTPTSSEHSNVPSSWEDVSDASLSTIDKNACREEDRRKNSFEMQRDSDKRREDKTQLEFISLPAGESSHTILFSTYNDKSRKESNETVADANADTVADMIHSKSACNPVEKSSKKKMQTKRTQEGSKLLENDRNENVPERITATDDILTLSNVRSDPISSNIREQFQNMFECMRLQNRIAINIPSPPRDLPRPDWNNSSLPNMSTVSEINLDVQSNGT